MAQSRVTIFSDDLRDSLKTAMPDHKNDLMFTSNLLETIRDIEGFGTAKVAAKGLSTLLVLLDPTVKELQKETHAGIEEIKASVYRIEDLTKKIYDLLKEEKHTANIKKIHHHFRMLMEQNEQISGLENWAAEFRPHRAAFSENLDSFLGDNMVEYFQWVGKTMCLDKNSLDPYFEAHDCIMNAIVMYFYIQSCYIRYVPDSVVAQDNKQSMAATEVERFTQNIQTLYKSFTEVFPFAYACRHLQVFAQNSLDVTIKPVEWFRIPDISETQRRPDIVTLEKLLGKNKAWCYFKCKNPEEEYKVYKPEKSGNPYAKFVSKTDGKTYVRPYSEKQWGDGYFTEETSSGSLYFGYEKLTPFNTVYFKKERGRRNIFCYLMDSKNSNIMYTFKADTLDWACGIIYDKIQ